MAEECRRFTDEMIYVDKIANICSMDIVGNLEWSVILDFVLWQVLSLFLWEILGNGNWPSIREK